MFYLDQAKIKLRWDKVNNYSPNKVQYKIECYRCTDYNPLQRFINVNSLNRNSMCSEKTLCPSYIKYSPSKEEIFENQLTLSHLDADTQYQIEIYAQHTDGLFKTKTVDILVRTNPALTKYQIINITSYQFTELNQIMVLWSNSALNPGKILNYELRYWPKQEFSNANVLSIQAPAQNFTLKNSNPDVLTSTIYVFQLRARTTEGWSSYSAPIEAIRIANFYRNTTSSMEGTRSTLFQSTLSTNMPYQFVERNAQSLTATVTIAVSVSLCFVIFSLVFLIFLSRSNRFKCLSVHLTKPVISSSSNSDCDSLDFAKRTAQMAYNPLGACSAGTRSSGHSSPMWPPLNSTKSYIDPHTYEDPTKVVSLFARELSPSNIIIESVIGGGEFGDVCKGCLKLSSWSDTIVAIKTLKGSSKSFKLNKG